MKLLNIDYKKCIYEILKGLLWYICILWLIRRKKTPLHSLVGTDSWLRSFKKLKPQKMWSTCIIILINHNDCNQPFAMKITFAIWRMAFVLANLLNYLFHKWISNEEFEICYLKLSNWPMARVYCLCTPNLFIFFILLLILHFQPCSRHFEFFSLIPIKIDVFNTFISYLFSLKHHLSYRFHFENISTILMAF